MSVWSIFRDTFKTRNGRGHVGAWMVQQLQRVMDSFSARLEILFAFKEALSSYDILICLFIF